ncbi:MAG TPA: ATP-binding protein [Aggregatilineales bacterium]|nr:HAMP domain-containing protein [Anaerolineales bacterium]HRE46703.1 ATP-binding protein [Aggregatilineales bacterium]
MISLGRLLTLSYFVIVLLSFALIAPLAWVLLEQTYLETQQANILAQARLAAQAVQSAAPPPAIPYSQSANILPGIHTHIIDSESGKVSDQPLPGIYTTMLAEEGPVLIALQSAPKVSQANIAPLPPLAQNKSGTLSPQELFSRPEIRVAFAGQPATAIRAVLDGRRVLYAAVPIIAAEGDITRIVYIAMPLPPSGWAALAPSARWQIAGLILLVLLLTALLGWGFSRGLARSLRQISKAANHVAAGNLNEHLITNSAVSDLRALSRAFNEMTESLRRADHMKMAFVADVSHELRTPLTVIKGTMETLQDGGVDDLSAREGFLSAAAEETERLIDLVNGLLTLARADGGGLNLHLAALNLTALAQTRVAHFQGIAAKKGIRLSVRPLSMHATDQPVCVWADSGRITQVLNNLLDNALRYSRRGDSVEVVVTPGKTQVTCAVVDSGQGIAAAHLPFLFNRFYRVDGSRNRNLGGSGLGLAISRAIIETHGGTIGVQSREGEGTTLTFILPTPPT